MLPRAVVAGADPGTDGICWHTFSHVPSLLFPSIWLLQVRISLRIHHNVKSTDSVVQKLIVSETLNNQCSYRCVAPM